MDDCTLPGDVAAEDKDRFNAAHLRASDQTTAWPWISGLLSVRKCRIGNG